MAMIELADNLVKTESEIFSKDGEYLSSIATANIGSPGGASITMEDGEIKQYDSGGTVRLKWTTDGIFQYDVSGNLRSEWKNNGERNVYDASGNVAIRETPN